MNIDAEIAFLDGYLKPKSWLGGEWFALRKRHDKEKMAFERDRNKMAYDTSPYRFAFLSLVSFIEEFAPRLHKYKETEGPERFANNEDIRRALKNPLNRQDILSVWTAFINDRLACLFPAGYAKLSRVNPAMFKHMESCQDVFDSAAHEWLSLTAPWDGSKAHHALIDWLIAAHQCARVND